MLDGSRVEAVEALGAGALHHARREARATGRDLALRAPSRILLSRLAAFPVPESIAVPAREREPWAQALGGRAWALAGALADGAAFGWEMLRGIALLLLRRERAWPGATLRQMHELGTTALPVVALLTTLIGLTLALLMGQQLSQFGASVHLATLMGVSFVREIGPLLSAVILAGRSGSAIAAELATMAVQEEIDALEVMGARTSAFLAAPRALALAATLPVLSLAACACGILAGLAVAVVQLDLDARTYAQFLSDAVTPSDLAMSMVKSAVFALVLAFVACRTGLSTRGGSDAVGRAATRAVVLGIFWTIVVDCLFSLALYL